MSSNRNVRAKMLKDFLSEICRDFADANYPEMTYLHWQRTFPVDGKAREYSVVLGNGAIPAVKPLDDETLAHIRAMETWANTGEGPNPADIWRQEHSLAAKAAKATQTGGEIVSDAARPSAPKARR